MSVEQVSHRVLGAVRLVDAATGAQAREALTMTAPGLRFTRNRRGYYVMYSADQPPALRAHAAAFAQPPTTPPLGSVSFTGQVTPAGKLYLPRSFQVSLPRDPDPAHSAQLTSLFVPVDVRLFPAATAPMDAGWAVLRATVHGTQTGQPPRPLGGALIRVLDAADNTMVRGRGLTDWRGRVLGEALVVVPGIPVTIASGGNGNGPVLVHEIDVILQVIFDPNAGPLPDPDQLEANLGVLQTSTQAAQLASGQHLAITLPVALD